MSLKQYHDFAKETFGVDLAFTTGNDYHIFSDVLQIVAPKRILETGFFKGGSAFMFLHLSTAHVTSVDPMVPTNGEPIHHGSLDNVGILQEVFRGRFAFLQKSSFDVRGDLAGQSFDLFNIDGDHHSEGIHNDFQLAVDLNIPWLLVDDFLLNVSDVYRDHFLKDYFPVKIYQRDDQFNGVPIPRALLRRRNPAMPHLPYCIQ